MPSTGIRVLGVPSDVSQRELKVYFSNPRNGGSKILKIYYPLEGNDAVILFENDRVLPKIFQQNHVLGGETVKVRALQKQVFSKVTVELGEEITALLDNDPKYLDDLQYDGELEVSSEDNYTITGDWYQMEWAWHYLDSVSNKGGTIQPISSKDYYQDSYQDAEDIGAYGISSNKEKEKIPPLAYPHNTENFSASGFQPYCYENWAEKTEYPNFEENTRGKHSEYATTGFDDFLARDTEYDDQLLRQIRAMQRQPQRGYTVSHEDFQDLPLTFDFNVSSLNVNVAMNNLLEEKSNAIVCSAPGDLSTRYGLSKIVARAADPKLKVECREHIDRHGPLSVGDVIHTSAGGSINENISFVIHAVNPSWKESESEECTHLLTCTYLNILQYASSHMWLQSVSMPLIGAGGVGFPLDVCVQALYDALLLFVLKEENLKHLKEVRLVSNDADSTCATIAVFRSLLDVDEISTQNAAKDRYIRRSIQFDFRAKDMLLLEENGDLDVDEKENNEQDKLHETEIKDDAKSNTSEESFEKDDKTSLVKDNSKEDILPESFKNGPFQEKLSSSETKQQSLIENMSRSQHRNENDVRFQDVQKESERKASTESLSSDDSIPLGMIDSDEDDDLSKQNLDIHVITDTKNHSDVPVKDSFRDISTRTQSPQENPNGDDISSNESLSLNVSLKIGQEMENRLTSKDTDEEETHVRNGEMSPNLQEHKPGSKQAQITDSRKEVKLENAPESGENPDIDIVKLQQDGDDTKLKTDGLTEVHVDDSY